MPNHSLARLRPAAAVLDDFMRLDPGVERWDNPAFAPVLADFRRRFKDTNTEEGLVMDTVLTYAMDQAYTSPRRSLLTDYRNSDTVRSRRIAPHGKMTFGTSPMRSYGVVGASTQPG